jgi:STE24 endopeptidase
MFTTLFVTALAVMVLIRLGLAKRQLDAITAHRDCVPEAFASSIGAADHTRAADYSVAKLRLARLELVWEALILLGLTLGGGFAWLDHVASHYVAQPVWAGVLTIGLLTALTSLLNLPFDLISTFRIESRFGFNRTTVRLYLSDLAKSVLLGSAIGAPLIAVLLSLMAAAGSLWWMYAFLTWAVFVLSLSFLWPRFIAPLFNRFRPLEAGPLHEAVEDVLKRCGFTSEGVFVMDGSRRSSHGNAYFTGFGRHKRIVLFDTLIERLTPTEVQAVLAHELGHFRLHHIRSRLLVMLIMAAIGFAILGQAAASPWFYQSLGVPTPSPQAALVLFALVIPVFTFFLKPISSAWSRQHEYAADRFAASHSSATELANALVKLYRDNASTLTPDRLYSAWHDSHPPALLRITALKHLA